MQEHKVKLNIGCARTILEGYINIDKFPEEYPHVEDKILQADAMFLPFDDNSVDEILADHFIEHLSYKEAKVTIEEWYRVLKIGGIVTVCVPDMDGAAKHWLAEYDQELTPETLNRWMNYWGQVIYGAHGAHSLHKSAWNASILTSFFHSTNLIMQKLWRKEYDFHLWGEFKKE